MIKQTRQIIAFAVGVMVTAIAILVLIAHWVNDELMKSWGGVPGMAVPTAICLIALGVDRIVFAIKNGT